MPTIDRKSRTRLRSRGEIDIKDMEQLRDLLAASHGDPDAWSEARPRVVRFLAQSVKVSDTALRIAEIYHNSPHLLPMRPPASVRD